MAIGAVAAGVGLRGALLVPAALSVLVAVLAGVMRPHDSVDREEEEATRESVCDGS